jgi:hypothetical protein
MKILMSTATINDVDGVASKKVVKRSGECMQSQEKGW